MGVLFGTRCYLIGSIECAEDPNDWRKKVQDELCWRGITFFNPLNKPFQGAINEDEAHRVHLKTLRDTGRYDELSSIMRKVRVEDLSMVDRCDFIICHMSVKKPSWGTAEELFLANREKKIILFSVEETKKQLPLWLFGTIDHKKVFDGINSLIRYVDRLDRGEISVDLDKWKLFKTVSL